MIKLIAIRPAGDLAFDLEFSDGSSGSWSAAPLIARDTDLTRPLADPAYFARAFIEAGRSPGRTGWIVRAQLHRRLDEAGELKRKAA